MNGGLPLLLSEHAPNQNLDRFFRRRCDFQQSAVFGFQKPGLNRAIQIYDQTIPSGCRVDQDAEAWHLPV